MFGEGLGAVVLGSVHCHGDETNIGECQARAFSNVHCSHHQDAGVSCGELIKSFLHRLNVPCFDLSCLAQGFWGIIQI